eukprot:6212950-Pleurochrysis_carterae.AAC.3
MGLTPAHYAHDAVIPLNRDPADSFGFVRDGRSAATSVDDFRLYHQKKTGSGLEVANLALMSRAMVRYWRSQMPF